METITFIPTNNRTRPGEPGSIADNNARPIFGKINFILSMVMRNTLKFNKLTSADEITEHFIALYDESDRKPGFFLDHDAVENICDILSKDIGILLKLRKNDKSYYKLNFKNYL
jgi:hypothetical protein